MPFKAHERAEKYAALRALTIPLGFIAGYAGGVAGSNDFAIDDGGKRRFVRSLIVLGNIIPNRRRWRVTTAACSHTCVTSPWIGRSRLTPLRSRELSETAMSRLPRT
jgi:hypothetical protein